MTFSLSALPENAHSLITAKRTSRNILSAEDNETPSVLDDILSRFRTSQLSLADYTRLTGPHSRPALYADEITDAVANRIVLEFGQLALMERSGLSFHDGHDPRPDQMKGKPSVPLRCGDRRSRFRYAAAHAATASRPVFSTPADPSKHYAFLEGSSAYMAGNATAELPDSVNQTDSDIDWREKGLHLRERRLPIANAVAQGTLSAVEGHRRFLRELTDCLNKKIREGKGGDERCAVTAQYRLVVQQLTPKLNPEFYDQCLFLFFGQDPQVRELRLALYPLRQTAMRGRNEIQSFLHKKIFDSLQQMTGRRRKPVGLKWVFRATLLTLLPPKESAYLEEWWGQPTSYYQQQAALPICNRARELCDRFSGNFELLRTNVGAFVQEAQTQERNYRSTALKVIRTLRGLSVSQVAQPIGKSEPEMMALESGLAECDSPTMRRLASTLKVPAVNVFMDQRTP